MRKTLLLFLALTGAAVQGAWGQTELMLYDSGENAADNSTTISSKSNDGNTYNVTLNGRTLYKDGDWNTLCLPFAMTAIQVAASPLAGATIMELGTASLDNSGLLTLNFSTATAIEAGKPYVMKWPVALTIKSKADWDTFVGNVALGETDGDTYAGKTVKLASDISIGSAVLGNKNTPFMGTFDGGGHTITCDITDTNDEGVAPFFYIKDATIMNVKVAGSVTGGNHCAGLVGFADGTNTIQNCWVAANVTRSTGSHCAGVLGHAQTSTTTISNCLYSGTITGGAAAVGIICGWSDNGATTTITNCLANGTYTTTTGTADMIQGSGTKTVTGCYQNIASEGKQGTYIGTISASDLVSSLGTNWQEADSKAVPVMNSNITNPQFSGVTIDKTERGYDTDNESVTTDARVRFLGTYVPQSFSEENKSILFLGAENTLYYPLSGASIGACRAYFKIGDDTASARQVTSFSLNFGDEYSTLGVTTPLSPARGAGGEAWYSLDGRRLSQKPSRAGVYINNGVKVVIK